MNTSRKGNRYEWAFQRELRKRPGTKFVLRMAASHGPFDLVQLEETPFDGFWTTFWQAKSSRMTCDAASKLLGQLWLANGMPTNFSHVVYGVVHRRTTTTYVPGTPKRRHVVVEKEFCEH